jgi:hypothetical protein
MTPLHREAASFCYVKLVEMTLDINLYELNARFDHCYFGNKTNRNSGKLFTIFIQKMY